MVTHHDYLALRRATGSSMQGDIGPLRWGYTDDHVRHGIMRVLERVRDKRAERREASRKNEEKYGPQWGAY